MLFGGENMSSEKKYQIFISSTFEDLKDARDIVMRSILTLEHIPVGMEMFAADGNDQWDIIKKTIDECDYYVIIVGHRYGSLSKEGISYTEKEYNYAKSLGVPILPFLRDEKSILSPGDFEADVEKQKKLKRLKDELKSNYLVKFWDTPDKLATNVVTSLTVAFTKRPRDGWIRPGRLENLENECKKLRTENDSLRNELSRMRLEVDKKPDLKISLGKAEFIYNNAPKVLLDYKSNCQKLTIEMVPEHLMEYITPQDIDEYNAKLPSKEQVQEYNLKMWISCVASSKEYELFPLYIENAGTSPATDISVSFEVPDGILIMRKFTMEQSEQPDSIMPINPIRRAENRYKKSLHKATGIDLESRLYAQIFPHYTDVFDKIGKIDPQILHNDKSIMIGDSDGEISVAIQQLQQEKMINMTSELVIIPMRTGIFHVPVRVMCNEYPRSEEQELVISIG